MPCPFLGGSLSVFITYLEKVFCQEILCTMLAVEHTAPLVNSQMLGQVGLLSEALVTAQDGALEGSLARVHPQVVKEVMPLSEVHSAACMVTLEKFYLAHRARIFVAKDAEHASLRHCLLYLDAGQVVVAASLHEDLRVVRDLLAHLAVANVVSIDDELGCLRLLQRARLLGESRFLMEWARTIAISII